jgi:hypothetical protein
MWPREKTTRTTTGVHFLPLSTLLSIVTAADLFN